MTQADSITSTPAESIRSDLEAYWIKPDGTKSVDGIETLSQQDIEKLDYITKQEEWLRESLRPFMPKSIFKGAYGLGKRRASRWLKKNNFHIVEDQAKGGKFLFRGKELISSFTPRLHVYGQQSAAEPKPESSAANELASV